mmetsp:Transcript_61457/g.102285  ORF Transcript_61457/g.102285 Transcript_61457/m.102285 type:complete len:543 (+) Transcript_61457:54-1682(+)
MSGEIRNHHPSWLPGWHASKIEPPKSQKPTVSYMQRKARCSDKAADQVTNAAKQAPTTTQSKSTVYLYDEDFTATDGRDTMNVPGLYAKMMVMSPRGFAKILENVVESRGVGALIDCMSKMVLFIKRFPADLGQKAFLKVLRSSVALTRLFLEHVLPHYMVQARRQIQKALADMHNKGEGIPLGQDGVMANYTLEVLRVNYTGSQAHRRVISQDGNVSYNLVRKGNLCETTERFGPEPIKSRGIIKRLTVRASPKTVPAPSKEEAKALRAAARTKKDEQKKDRHKNLTSKQNKDAAKKQAGGSLQAHSAVAAKDKQPKSYIEDAANEYLDNYFSNCKCIASLLKRYCGRTFKSHLPIQLPASWLPPLMRDEPEKVLTVDVELDIALRFDSRDALLPAELEKLANFTSLAVQENPFQFELEVRGHNGWPTLGQVMIKNISIEAHCLVWWDVFDDVLELAFIKEDPPHVQWDIELSLFRCGCPLPNCFEDSVLTFLTNLVLRTFNRANPLHLDFAAMTKDSKEGDEEEETKTKRKGLSHPSSRT